MQLAFGNGSPGQVVSNRRFERRLAVLDARLDTALAAAVGPELRALRSRRDTERLPSADMVKLRQLEAAIEALPLIERLRQERRSFIKNFMHQVSKGVIARLAREHVNVLVLGQNKGWKNGAQGADKGRAFNRRNLRVGHAQLLEQLRYKCEAAGILLVTTEESYTSKTSFALNETLRTHPRAQSSTGSTESPNSSPGAEPSETRTPPLGRRQRHVFKSPGATGLWASLHADLNGAYNILRKVFLHFQWHAALSARFTLLWLSPKKGLTEFAQRGDIPFRGRAGALPVL